MQRKPITSLQDGDYATAETGASSSEVEDHVHGNGQNGKVHKMSAVQLSKLEPVPWKLQVTLVGMVDRVAVGDMETAKLLTCSQ